MRGGPAVGECHEPGAMHGSAMDDAPQGAAKKTDGRIDYDTSESHMIQKGAGPMTEMQGNRTNSLGMKFIKNTLQGLLYGQVHGNAEGVEDGYGYNSLERRRIRCKKR